MFTPTRSEVRQFFIQAWQRAQTGQPLEPLELLASQWIAEHPEYHTTLNNPEAAHPDWVPPAGGVNPFMHLSMHLSLSEQCSIDQPAGVRAAVEQLTQKHDDLHHAHHMAMQALEQMLWTAQQTGQPPEPNTYIEQLRQLI